MGRKEWAGTKVRPVISVEHGRTLLRVGGVIQSVVVDQQHQPDVWDAMLPTTCPESALILGLGGGTIATLLTRHFGPIPILGVERDPRIAELARQTFGLSGLPNIQIAVADAFTFLPQCQTHFDLICVDLYVAGRMEHGVLGAGFLHQINRVLAPGGTAVFNIWRSPYFHDHLRRLQRMLNVLDVSDVGGNVIVRCAARPLVAILPR